MPDENDAAMRALYANERADIAETENSPIEPAFWVEIEYEPGEVVPTERMTLCGALNARLAVGSAAKIVVWGLE